MQRVILLSVILFWSIQSKAFPVKITGEIEHATQHLVTLYFLNDPVLGKPVKDPVSAKVVEGKFEFTFDLEKNRNAFVRYGQSVGQMYIMDGADIQVTFDENDFQNTLEFSGKGSGPNKFISAFGKKFTERNKEIYSVKRRQMMNDSLSFEDYTVIEKKFMEDRIQFVKKSKKKFDLPESFVDMLCADIKYGTIKSLFHLANKKKLPYDSKGYEFVNWVDLKDEKAGELSSNYHEVLKQYFQYEYMKENNVSQIGDKYFLKLMYDKGVENLQGHAKDVFLSSTMYLVVLNKWGFLIDTLYPRFLEDVKNEMYVSAVQEAYKAYEYEKNLPVPDGAHIIDKPFRNVEEIFAMFKGKVIYVDVWASWCGPCKREMPHSLKLQKKFSKDEDVVFLFLDVNDKQVNWKRTLKNLGITGEHVYCSKQLSNEFMSKYGIRGIPRYLIVNKKGEVVDENAPRPSWENAEEAIRKHL